MAMRDADDDGARPPAAETRRRRERQRGEVRGHLSPHNRRCRAVGLLPAGGGGGSGGGGGRRRDRGRRGPLILHHLDGEVIELAGQTRGQLSQHFLLGPLTTTQSRNVVLQGEPFG